MSKARSRALSLCPLSAKVLLTRRGWTAWLVLAAGLLLTAGVEQVLRNQQHSAAEKQFQQHVYELVAALTKRMKDHEQILLGGVGLFEASDQVSRTDWRTYVERLQLDYNYPGIQGVGFSLVVQPNDLAAHIESVRNEGFAQYTLRPPGDRPLYTAIIYLEPFAGRNLAAFGYDMYSEPTRRQAMQRAAENAVTAISGKVRLVQETHGVEQAGFLMYVPVYRPGMPLQNPAQRWQALRGFVYSPYRVDDLMRGILGSGERVIDFKIYDGESISPAGLMYDSSNHHSPDEGAPAFNVVQRIRAYGQVWTVSLHNRPAFFQQFASPLQWLTPVLGMIISILMFALVSTLLNRREHALVLAEDMSKRRAESEERFRQLFLSVGQGVVVHDAEGFIVEANPAAEAILGMTIEQMRTFGSFDPQWRVICADGSVFAADQYPVMVALREGRAVADVTMGVWQPTTQSWRWILVSAYPRREFFAAGNQRVYALFSDITERKKSEALVREQAEHTQAILDHMVDGIITIDAGGIMHSFNPAATRIFGYQVDEVLGQNVSMLMPNPHREAHDGYLRSHRAGGEARIIGVGREVEGQRRDGSLFPMDLAVSEVTREGRPLYVGMVRDISERKRIERLKTEFVSTVSHELRTPLTSISGALGLVAGGVLGDLPSQARSMIDIAAKNCQRLTLLINDLLDMDKISEGKLRLDMQAHALMPLLQEALDANASFANEHNVVLTLTGCAEGATVQVDEQRFMQVLANLLSNAVKFSSARAKVKLGVEVIAANVRVSVTDQGPGIPEAFRSCIFQKFSQADATDTRQKGGTGLGLAITRELVQRMGGEIGFDSVEGDGATFWFELPLYQEGGECAVSQIQSNTIPL